MDITIDVDSIADLTDQERKQLQSLIDTYNLHSGANREKNRYYEGKISLAEVNLGIALPDGIRKLEIGCSWGGKTVDVLAGMSMFDGFVGTSGEKDDTMNALVLNNRLIAEYMKACRDELKYGCTFATLSADQKIGCKIRFHSPETAAAQWSGELGRIECGFAIIDTAPDNSFSDTWSPSVINFYTDNAVIVLKKTDYVWEAERFPHKMGRPLMEAMIWNATSSKPFGRSRIKEPIRRLIQGYVRTIANATIGLEFSTAPQKYLLGLTDEQYDAVIDQKFKQYVGSIIAATWNPDSNEKPAFGQLPQGNISPHVEMIRILATQFSAATGLTVTDTGVVSEANPTSADAVLAQTKTLVGMAEQLNTGNGDALRTIGRMAIAIIRNKRLDELADEEQDIIAHFKNPAMPNISATTDAALKIATARPEFSGTDIFLEMIGFDQAAIRRIKQQEARVRGQQILAQEIEDGDQQESMGTVQEQDGGS